MPKYPPAYPLTHHPIEGGQNIRTDQVKMIWPTGNTGWGARVVLADLGLHNRAAGSAPETSGPIDNQMVRTWNGPECGGAVSSSELA
jgi:hypothetical protein